MGVDVSTDGAVTTVTINWPAQRNALSPDRMEHLADELHAAAHSGASVVVLTGAGAFCSGADLNNVAHRPAMTEASRRALVAGVAQGLIWTVIESPVPILAAIDGPAIGLGFDLALACDCRLIGTDGWCMQGWGRVGLIPGIGGELLLRMKNPWLLWKLLEEQPRIDGLAAERWGLAEAVHGSALAAAQRRAAALAELPRETLVGYTTLFRSALQRDLPAHHAECAALQARLLGDLELSARVGRVLHKAPKAAAPSKQNGRRDHDE